MECKGSEVVVFPACIHRDTVMGTETPEAAGMPLFWQTWQNTYLITVALQKHLNNARSACRVAVNAKDIFFCRGYACRRDCKHVRRQKLP